MKMIIHSQSQNEIMNQLKELIECELPEIQVEMVASNLRLSKRLNRPLNNVSILVSCIESSNDITELRPLKPLFDNTKQILILPNRSREMMESGLQLGPSYMSYHDSNIMDILSVVRKIYQKRKKSS